MTEPFVATGWPTALWAKADILLRAGRPQEALNLVRPDEAGPASKAECHDFAELLVRAGRVDEAIDLLVPHIDGWWTLSVLVEITADQERDEQVLELISPHADSARQTRGESRWNHPFSNAQELQAQVLERTGRADEAIGILGQDIAADHYLTQKTLTAYAGLLARHGPGIAPATRSGHRAPSAPLATVLHLLGPLPSYSRERQPCDAVAGEVGPRPQRAHEPGKLTTDRTRGSSSVRDCASGSLPCRKVPLR